jgi:hypothetical protein
MLLYLMRTTAGVKMYCSRLNSGGSLASSRGLLMMPSFTSLRHVPCGSTQQQQMPTASEQQQSKAHPSTFQCYKYCGMRLKHYCKHLLLRPALHNNFCASNAQCM